MKKARVTPRLFKVTRTDGTVVVDAESGLLVGAFDHEHETQAASSRRAGLDDAWSRPPESPNPKLSRN